MQRHQALGKENGKTSFERFNNTLKQGVGRLVRKTLSFSKILNNHIGVIWHFIHHYNGSLHYYQLFFSILLFPVPRSTLINKTRYNDRHTGYVSILIDKKLLLAIQNY